MNDEEIEDLILQYPGMAAFFTGYGGGSETDFLIGKGFTMDDYYDYGYDYGYSDYGYSDPGFYDQYYSDPGYGYIPEQPQPYDPGFYSPEQPADYYADLPLYQVTSIGEAYYPQPPDTAQDSAEIAQIQSQITQESYDQMVALNPDFGLTPDTQEMQTSWGMYQALIEGQADALTPAFSDQFIADAIATMQENNPTLTPAQAAATVNQMLAKTPVVAPPATSSGSNPLSGIMNALGGGSGGSSSSSKTPMQNAGGQPATQPATQPKAAVPLSNQVAASSIIPGVDNTMLLLGAGVAAFFLMKGK